jgi:hypothetical protein
MSHLGKRFGFQAAKWHGLNRPVKHGLPLLGRLQAEPSASAHITIRASQVTSVYPFTQDLGIGDVFLVQTLISKQEQDCANQGFLPLGDHRVRLPFTNRNKLLGYRGAIPWFSLGIVPRRVQSG